MNEDWPAREWLVKADQALDAASSLLPEQQRPVIQHVRALLDGLFADVIGTDPWLQTR